MNLALTRTILAATIAASVGTTLFSIPPTLASPYVRSQTIASAVWLPDTALAATLGPQVVVAGYKMRLPVGYAADLKKEQAKSAFKVKFFSLHRADDLGSTMFVMALSFPPSDGGGRQPRSWTATVTSTAGRVWSRLSRWQGTSTA